MWRWFWFTGRIFLHLGRTMWMTVGLQWHEYPHALLRYPLADSPYRIWSCHQFVGAASLATIIMAANKDDDRWRRFWLKDIPISKIFFLLRSLGISIFRTRREQCFHGSTSRSSGVFFSSWSSCARLGLIGKHFHLSVRIFRHDRAPRSDARVPECYGNRVVGP